MRFGYSNISKKCPECEKETFTVYSSSLNKTAVCEKCFSTNYNNGYITNKNLSLDYILDVIKKQSNN